MTLDEQRQAFIAALERDPFDEDTHRIYADWLDEFGSEKDAEKAAWERAWTPARQHSENWLRNFAELIREDGEPPVPLEDVIEAGRYASLYADSNVSISGSGYKAESLMERADVREEFWAHWEKYTGLPVNESTKEHEVFTCCGARP